jgi:hypothetical protein
MNVNVICRKNSLGPVHDITDSGDLPVRDFLLGLMTEWPCGVCWATWSQFVAPFLTRRVSQAPLMGFCSSTDELQLLEGITLGVMCTVGHIRRVVQLLRCVKGLPRIAGRKMGNALSRSQDFMEVSPIVVGGYVLAPFPQWRMKNFPGVRFDVFTAVTVKNGVSRPLDALFHRILWWHYQVCGFCLYHLQAVQNLLH